MDLLFSMGIHDVVLLGVFGEIGPIDPSMHWNVFPHSCHDVLVVLLFFNWWMYLIIM